jgi:DNA polymerase-3 subunit gamma/tau
VGFTDDVLTLSFRSPADVASFKKLAAGKGPSEDLRGAIQQVLGIRVKYVAKHDPSLRARDAERSGASGADGSDRAPSDAADPDRAGGTPTQHDNAADSGSALPGRSSAQTPPSTAPRPAETASSAPPAPARASAAAAPVTEWAVARIPGGEAADAPLAVDDEPEDAAVAPVRTMTLEREGDVLTDDDAPLTSEEEEELPPPLPVDAPIPPRAPVAVERPAPSRTARTNGIERVGEAVVRQMLGATYVREEPYTPPTRFN